MTGLCDMCACACAGVCVCVLSYVQLFVTPWTEAPPGSSVPGIFPGKNTGELPFPPPGDLPKDQIHASCVPCISRRIPSLGQEDPLEKGRASAPPGKQIV